MSCLECKGYANTCPICEEGEVHCEVCGASMEISDSGVYRGIIWNNYICPQCGEKLNNEPDEDLEYDTRKNDF